MSWLCPYQLGELCNRVKKICEPDMKGCVLRGKVKFVEFEGEVNVKTQKKLKDLAAEIKSVNNLKR